MSFTVTKLDDRRKARRMKVRESMRKWIKGKWVYFKEEQPVTKKEAMKNYL